MILMLCAVAWCGAARKKKDYYEVLGVQKEADSATLKKAYRKMALCVCQHALDAVDVALRACLLRSLSQQRSLVKAPRTFTCAVGLLPSPWQAAAADLRCEGAPEASPTSAHTVPLPLPPTVQEIPPGPSGEPRDGQKGC